MKTYKKIGIGLGLVLLVLTGLFHLQKALAAVPPITLGNDFKFVDAAHITGTVNGNLETFYDSDVSGTNSIRNWQPQGNLTSGAWCNYKTSGTQRWGIDVAASDYMTKQSVSATLELGYLNGNNCTPTSKIAITISNPASAAGAQYAYDGSGNIVSVDGSQTFVPAANNAGTYILPSKLSSCEAFGVIITSSQNSGVLYILATVGSSLPAKISTLLKNPDKCKLVSQQTIPIAGSPGSGNNPTGTVAADNSCEANYTGAGHELNWLFCGLLRSADTLFSTLFGIIQDQLDLCTGTSATTGAPCQGNILPAQVHKSWAVFRDLATALLVIAMLIMVFSQALSFGPFDAYTVRKMLPKLAAAAILMQISWPILKYSLDIVNDLGHGIQALMLVPFGGVDNLHFDDLASKSGGFATGVATTGLFTAAIAGTILSGLTIGGVALIAGTVILSLIIGFVILLFRQMLIILLVILAPIALLMWILPGTQRYWKLWSDNFSKLLLMFPLIMAMIAAGQIFAYVGANTGAGGGILAFLMVLIGFFAPFWFLPKTFRWGGQLFSAAANGTLSATKGFRRKPYEYASKQMAANRAQKATDRYNRLSYGEGRRFDKFMAAAGGFGLSKSATEVRQARNRAEGREEGEKEVNQAITGSAYEQQDHNNKLVTLDTVAQGKKDELTGLDGSNPAMQRWALDQLATFGDWDRIDALRTADKIDERTWQTFVAKNISAIHQNAPHLSPIRRDMSALGYAEYGNWKDHSFHEYERQISNGLVRSSDGKGWDFHADPTRQRALAIENAKKALTDERVRANLSAEAVTVLDRISKMDNPENAEVNVGPSRRGAPPDVQLPAGHALQANPVARQNLTSALLPTVDTPENRSKRESVIENVAIRLANPSLRPDDPERQGMEAFLSKLRNQAASSGNGAAIQVYNEIINQARQAAQAIVDQERERTQGIQGRLKPIPQSQP
jgi:hypothetical protein